MSISPTCWCSRATTKEIRAYVLADYLLGRHAKLSEDLFRQREQMYRSGTRISLLTGLVTGTALALAYVFVAVHGLAGTIDPGGVVLVIGAFTSVVGNARPNLQHIRRRRSAHDVPRRLLLVPRHRAARARARRPHRFRPGAIESIEFDNVTFAYPGGTEPAVDGSEPARFAAGS